MTESRIRPEWVTHMGLISAILPEPPYVQKYQGSQPQDLEARYEHATSEAALDRFVAEGVNLVYLRFFAGYGLEFEKPPMERTRELIRGIQTRGMKAGLLVTFGALTLETLLLEESDAHNWLQYNTDGKHVVAPPMPFSPMPMSMGSLSVGAIASDSNTQAQMQEGREEREERSSVSVRVRPCYHSENYLRAMERICSLALDFGADLIHFDEFGFNPEPDTCRCPSCIAAFREFLRDQYGLVNETTISAGQERFGHNSFAHVRPPAPTAGEPFSGPHDAPHNQEWIRFKIATLSDALQRITRFIFKRSPSCAVGVDLFKYFGWESEVLYGLSAEVLLPWVDVARIVSVAPHEVDASESGGQNSSDNSDEKQLESKRVRSKKSRRDEMNEPSLFSDSPESQRALRLDTPDFSHTVPAENGTPVDSKIGSKISWLPLAALTSRSFDVALECVARVRNLDVLDSTGTATATAQSSGSACRGVAPNRENRDNSESSSGGSSGSSKAAWIFNPRSLGSLGGSSLSGLSGSKFYRQIKETLANVAPMRSVALFQETGSVVFGEGSYQELQNRVQQRLLEERAAFEPLYETQLHRLSEYRCVVLAGCECLSNEAAECLTRFVENGGELIALGAVGLRDPWRRVRSTPALQHLAVPSRAGAVFLPSGALDELFSRLRVHALWDLETSSRKLFTAGYRRENSLYILVANTDTGVALPQSRVWLRCERTPVRMTIQSELCPNEELVFSWDNGRANSVLPNIEKNSQILISASFEN